MLSAFYKDGSVSVESGSTTVTGTGTAWTYFGVAGGLFQIPGYPAVPIESVETDGSLTLHWGWPHATQEDEDYAIALVTADQVAGLKTNWLLSQILARSVGFAFAANATGSLAQRATYDGESEGFVYGILDDPENPRFYRKASDVSGDWEGPFPWRGPAGQDGEDADLASILAAATPQAGSDGATLAVDLELGEKLFHTFTIAGNRTLGFPTNAPNAGITFNVLVKQDGVGGRTLDFAAGYVGHRGVKPTIGDNAAEETLLVVVMLAADRAAVLAVGQDFS